MSHQLPELPEPEIEGGIYNQTHKIMLRGPVHFTAALQQPALLKDHQIAQTVNAVRDVAIKFHDHQSLRERIAEIIVPALQEQAPADKDAEPDAINARRYLQLREHAGQIGMLLWRHAPWTHESADENKARLDLCLDEEFVDLQSQSQQVTK